jgi:hypothetical protein
MQKFIARKENEIQRGVSEFDRLIFASGGG